MSFPRAASLVRCSKSSASASSRTFHRPSAASASPALIPNVRSPRLSGTTYAPALAADGATAERFVGTAGARFVVTAGTRFADADGRVPMPQRANDFVPRRLASSIS